MIRPHSAAALDGAAERAHEARVLHAERVVRGLICAAGGPFVQRQPTRAQCCTGVLDALASRSPAWLRSWAGRSVLRRYELTWEQVDEWREAGHG